MRAINYFGGKGHLLSRLLPHLNPPGIESFVDVFGGSASVILNREPSKCNTYNDKFEDVVHFFRVLRESGEELIRALELTPYSRQEYLESWPIQHPNDIERARMFFIRCMQSYGAHGHFHKHSAWPLSKTEYTQGVSQSLYRWISRVNGLAEVVVALKKIQIECLDFREIIAKYGQHGALLYLDPPYVLSTRTGSTRYALEMSDEDHIQMGGALIESECLWAISIYDCDLVRDIYRGHHFLNLGEAKVNNGRSKPEMLITNYSTVKMLPQLFNANALPAGVN